jgi:uncharacterized protein YndB with AHSA1/START domain
MAKAAVSLLGDKQIQITRMFDATRPLVWRTITEPDLIKRWWGGERGSVSSVEVDLRVGGTWRYVMTANGGFEVGFHGEYREIAAPARLVNTEAYEGMPEADAHAALCTMTLTEKDGRTYLELLVDHVSQANRDAHINSGMEGGMQESYDKLEEVAISLA